MATVSSVLTATTVAPRLLEYLESHLDIRPLRYAERPTFIEEGWETYICRFQLASRITLPKPFTAPLVLRVYANGQGWPRLAHEYEAKEHLRCLGYPVPRPVLIEHDADWFAGPFMIMEALPGRSMLAFMYDWFPAIFYAPAQMAKMHARLHQLPAAGFAHEPGRFLDRRLNALDELLAKFDLAALEPGLTWLKRHKPPQESPSIFASGLPSRESAC
jgi:aminoglycoside phosphotransferase (APT) family kinase protein